MISIPKTTQVSEWTQVQVRISNCHTPASSYTLNICIPYVFACDPVCTHVNP